MHTEEVTILVTRFLLSLTHQELQQIPQGQCLPQSRPWPIVQRVSPPSCTPCRCFRLGGPCHCPENANVPVRMLQPTLPICQTKRTGQGWLLPKRREITQATARSPGDLLSPTGAHTPHAGNQLQNLSLDHLQKARRGRAYDFHVTPLCLSHFLLKVLLSRKKLAPPFYR